MPWSSKLRVLVCASALAGCSSDGAATPTADAGSSSSFDASLPDTGSGITLDAAPTAPDTGPPSEDAGAPSDAAGPACVPVGSNQSCGLDPQCGCGASQTCDVSDLSGDTTCVAAGTALAGHACLTTASCAPGLTCLGGACRAYCARSGDAGCLDAGGPCVGVGNGDADGGLIPFDDVCTFACDLTNPRACGSTGSLLAGCVVNGPGTDCSTAGVVGANGDCSSALCSPGFTCVTFQGGPTECKAWCHVDADASADASAECAGDDAGSCVPFTTAVVANGTQYGFCP